MWLQLFPMHIHSPKYVEPLLLDARGAALADIEYSPVPNMQGQIAGSTTFSQLFIYMNNCLQFWVQPTNRYFVIFKLGSVQLLANFVIFLSPKTTTRPYWGGGGGVRPQ